MTAKLYEKDTAEKSVEGPGEVSVHQDSPPDGQKPSPTQAPPSEWKPPSTSDLHMLKIRGKTYRISDTQIAKSVWKDGEATFSRSHAEHLAFLEAQGQIAAEKTREIEKSKQETDRLHTQEHQKRADITVDMHRQIVQYHKRPRPLIQEEGQVYLLSPCPLGHSPTHCIANPCDNRPQCDKEHRINHGALKFDHGDLTEGYVT